MPGHPADTGVVESEVPYYYYIDDGGTTITIPVYARLVDVTEATGHTLVCNLPLNIGVGTSIIVRSHGAGTVTVVDTVNSVTVTLGTGGNAAMFTYAGSCWLVSPSGTDYNALVAGLT